MRHLAGVAGIGVLFALGCASSNKARPQYPTWYCYSKTWQNGISERWAFTLQYRTLETGEKVGNVWVAGVKHAATYRVEGINRRWDFDGGRYAITLSPEGVARYYNFKLDAAADGKAEERQRYQCKRK